MFHTKYSRYCVGEVLHLIVKFASVRPVITCCLLMHFNTLPTSSLHLEFCYSTIQNNHKFFPYVAAT